MGVAHYYCLKYDSKINFNNPSWKLKKRQNIIRNLRIKNVSTRVKKTERESCYETLQHTVYHIACYYFSWSAYAFHCYVIYHKEGHFSQHMCFCPLHKSHATCQVALNCLSALPVLDKIHQWSLAPQKYYIWALLLLNLLKDTVNNKQGTKSLCTQICQRHE